VQPTMRAESSATRDSDCYSEAAADRSSSAKVTIAKVALNNQ